LPAGSAYDPRDKPGLAAFTADMLNEGAGSLNSQAYQTALSNKAIHLSVTPTRDYLVISLVMLKENAKDAFHLLGLALTKPRFEADAISRVRGQIVAALQQEDQDPQTVASKAFMVSFFGNHPYAHSINGTQAAIAHINRNDIKTFAQTHWVRNGLK